MTDRAGEENLPELDSASPASGEASQVTNDPGKDAEQTPQATVVVQASARRPRTWASVLAVVLGGALAIGFSPAAGRLPPQPIAFSHKTHIDRKMACSACHAQVYSGSHAGLPDGDTCKVCHEKPIVNSVDGKPQGHETDPGLAEQQKLSAKIATGEPLKWFVTPALPAHTIFSHAVHLRQWIDCTECHGDVSQMSITRPAVAHTMNWCIDCHKSRYVTTDCYMCHK